MRASGLAGDLESLANFESLFLTEMAGRDDASPRRSS
jgi:hypothetical protein